MLDLLTALDSLDTANYGFIILAVIQHVGKRERSVFTYIQDKKGG